MKPQQPQIEDKSYGGWRQQSEKDSTPWVYVTFKLDLHSQRVQLFAQTMCSELTTKPLPPKHIDL